jgi:hypothetical protein
MNWIDDILFAHEHNKKPHFKIYKGSTKGTPVFESDGEGDFDHNHAKLKLLLPRLRMPGQYVIQFKGDRSANTGLNDFPFEIPYSSGFGGQQQPGIGAMLPAQTGMSKEELRAEIEREKRMWDLEQTLREMKARSEKLEADLKKAEKEASPFGEALEMFKPHLPTIMGLIQRRAGLPGTQVAISGVNAENVPPQEQQSQTELTPAEVQECRDKLNEAIGFFVEQEGGYKQAVDLIYKLYLKAKQDPSQIALLKQLL